MNEVAEAAKPFVKLLWCALILGLACNVFVLWRKMFGRKGGNSRRGGRSGGRRSVWGDAPNCPICGKKMVLRRRKSDGGKFFGCSSYPECRGIVNVQ